MESAPPPVYSTTSQDSGYDSAPPPSYYSKIGQRTIGEPLVSVLELKAHLRLLRAFSELKQQVDNATGADLGLPFAADKDRNWTVFVALAVERFERYCLTLTDAEANVPGTDNTFLPPLDVFMVWHAYLLNPLRYAEDADINICIARLAKVGVVLDKLDRVVDTLTSAATMEREDGWTKRTGLIFDPMVSAQRLRHRVITCPTCSMQASVALLDAAGQGYLQHAFKHICIGCSLVVTKDVLAVHKLAKDLTNDSAYLPGTVHSPEAKPDFAKSKDIKNKLLLSPVLARPKGASVEAWITNIQTRVLFKPSIMQATMSTHAGSRGNISVQRTTMAYADDRIFSLDLTGAVIRQESFIHKMTDLRWTQPEFTNDTEDDTLFHAVARYHAFLDLMSSSPATFFVPTLDIDLAWHTHQLRSKKYNNDCAFYVGRYVNHNDRVEENKLSNAFDITCRAWEDRFHIRYAHCGCPLPGDKLGKRLSHFIGSKAEQAAPSELVPPADRPDLLAATHASEHNAVHVFKHAAQATQSEHMRAQRREKYNQRLLRDQKKAQKGELDAEYQKRQAGHDPAFLTPVQFWYAPVGCVAATGHIASGTAGAGGSGCGGCGSGGCGGGGCGSGGCGGGGGGGS